MRRARRADVYRNYVRDYKRTQSQAAGREARVGGCHPLTPPGVGNHTSNAQPAPQTGGQQPGAAHWIEDMPEQEDGGDCRDAAAWHVDSNNQSKGEQQR